MKLSLIRKLLITLTGLLTLLLSSCKIDGEEEITLHGDGSADIRIQYIFPYKAFSKSEAAEVHTIVKQIASRHPELVVNENSSSPYGNYAQKINLNLSFASALDVKSIVEDEQKFFAQSAKNAPDGETPSKSFTMIEAIFGNLDAAIAADGIHYDRQVDLSPLFAGKIKNGDILGDAEFRYILTTPLGHSENNATEVLNNGKSLLWKIPLRTYFNKPFTLKATLASNYFTTAWIILALLTTATLLYLRKRKRNLHSTSKRNFLRAA